MSANINPSTKLTHVGVLDSERKKCVKINVLINGCISDYYFEN